MKLKIIQCSNSQVSLETKWKDSKKNSMLKLYPKYIITLMMFSFFGLIVALLKWIGNLQYCVQFYGFSIVHMMVIICCAYYLMLSFQNLAATLLQGDYEIMFCAWFHGLNKFMMLFISESCCGTKFTRRLWNKLCSLRDFMVLV